MKGTSDRMPAACLLLLGLIVGWTFGSVSEARAQTKPGLAILPFFAERIEDPARGAVCPICKSAYRSGGIKADAENILNRLLAQKIEALGTFRIVPSDRVDEAIARMGRKELEEKAMLLAPRLGKEVGAEFVLFGFVFRFEERVGSSLGVEKPASVGFDLHLFRVRDGVILWMMTFDETQKPLSDNVLNLGSFVRRGASWAKAEELASAGVGEILKKLPGPEELETKK